MLNSPKTSTSLSQLQNAYQFIVNNKSHSKCLNYNHQNQSVIHLNKNINYSTSPPQHHTSQDNYHSTPKPSTHTQKISNSQFSLDQQQPNQLGIDSRIHSISKNNSNKLLIASSSTQVNSYHQARSSHQSSQTKIFNQKRVKELKQMQRKNNNQKKALQQSTQNTSSNSYSLNNHRQDHRNSSNNLRKSVQNQAMLLAIQSMFRKKNLSIIDAKQLKDQQNKINKVKELRLKQQKIKEDQNVYRMIRQKIKQKAVLGQRLKNIHLFYKMKIKQESDKRRNNDRIFMDLLHENQKIHQQKLNQIKMVMIQQKSKMMNVSKSEKLINSIDNKKQQNIKQLQRQKRQYRKLQNELNKIRQRIQQKEKTRNELQEQQRSMRQQVEKNEKTQLKVKKWRRQLEMILIKGQAKVQNIKKNFQKQEDYY